MTGNGNAKIPFYKTLQNSPSYMAEKKSHKKNNPSPVDFCLCVYGVIQINRLEEADPLIVTQEDLIRQIADREEMNTSVVRKIFKSAEAIIFDCLSSTSPSENTIIKLMDGLSLECHYIPEKEIHTYDNIRCRSRIWTKPKVTRYYNRKLNGYFKK